MSDPGSTEVFAARRPVAVVTGATGGIGKAICRALAPAWQVVGTCHSTSEALADQWRSEVGPSADLIRMDLTHHEESTSRILAVIEQHGCPGLLVNCAGITSESSFATMAFGDWERVITTNLVSLFSVTQPVYRAMTAAGSGAIVNISSVNGERGQAGQTNYCASKAGVHGFTMALAKEGARFGVRVNTVSPGYTLTPMVSAMRPDVQARVLETIPLARFAMPKEVAAMVKYLASSEAAYITGSNRHINGGLHIG